MDGSGIYALHIEDVIPLCLDVLARIEPTGMCVLI